ncbi:hypothetical protein BCR32DRAFT_272138 [Anaeromyces robustus]|uniref:Mid2 domain-containing protein n=1 Tax=Anaeromyces robustus TaxID=1754192 RepID=A0A1Y1WNL9_9FUNG|nr:hypothetical protein BCR32DRAFT_272138 [Anaeromyces robustus]|eukprot:ORX75072.1 hypothetical protein BCR32DRAFT_272138 [Anaeromyces robustus]
MEMKYLFLILFLLNVLSLVYAQDHSTSTSTSQTSEHNHSTNTGREVENSTVEAPPKIITTSKSEHSTDPENSTIPAPIYTFPIITSLDSTMVVVTSSVSVTSKILATKTVPTKTTTTTTTKIPTVKNYPQETFVPWRKSENKAMRDADVLMKFYYVLSGAIIATFIGVASFILYKKGIAEPPSTQPSRVWENSLDDNSFRNKSTISRSTLTRSVNNQSLPLTPSSNNQSLPNPNNS